MTTTLSHANQCIKRTGKRKTIERERGSWIIERERQRETERGRERIEIHRERAKERERERESHADTEE